MPKFEDIASLSQHRQDAAKVCNAQKRASMVRRKWQPLSLSYPFHGFDRRPIGGKAKCFDLQIATEFSTAGSPDLPGPACTSASHANILAASGALAAHEIMTLLVPAALAACTSTDVATARALPTAKELIPTAIVADDGARMPARAFRLLGHWVVQTFGHATLASRCLARVATALVSRPAHEVASRALATSATGAQANVTATSAASTTLELVAIPIDAH